MNSDQEPAKNDGAAEERLIVAGTLRAFVRGMIPITLLWAVVYSSSVPPHALRTWVQASAFTGIGVLALRLLQAGRTQAASWLMLGSTLFVVTVSVLSGGGVLGPAYASFSAMIVLAGVTLGSGASTFVTLFSVAVGAVCLRLASTGRLPGPVGPNAPLSAWLASCLVFATVATLQQLFARTARNSLARARAENERRRVADRAREEAAADLERAHAALEANEHRYRGMFESAPVALFEVDLSRLPALRQRFETKHPGEALSIAISSDPELIDALASELRVLDANAQAVRMMEAPNKQSLVGTYRDLFVPENRKQVVALAVALEQGNPSAEQELVLRTARGRQRRVLIVARREPAPAPLERIVASAVDVTEQRMLEERTRAAQRMETIGRFSGGVAHDFNNALSVITSWIDLLRRPTLDERVRAEGLAAIATSARSAAQLTRQLMSIGRRDVRAPRPTSLTEVIDEALATVSRLLPSDVRVVVEHGTSALAMVDEAQLHQVLLNLAINARDAMPEGGTLEVRTRLAPPESVSDLAAGRSYVELAVRDSGSGMDAATRERIFEPFFTTKGEGRGTGLGLATVHAIVTDSQGKITVESEPGRGALFRVYLPVAEVDLGAEPQPPSIDAQSAPHGAGRRVLLVEDEEAMREVMVRVLTDGGYEVLGARDGEEALALARASGGPLHVLCTDGILPGLRTDALIAQFRELYPQARVLVCSGHLQEDLVRRRIAEGECAFVQKPFSADELLRAVGELAPPEVEYTR